MRQYWKPALRGKRAARAAVIAREVAKRCSARANIDRALASEQNCSPDTVIRWHASSVAGGDASIALLCAYMQVCFPKERWSKTAHEYLARAIDAYAHATPNLGMFGGATGLAVTVSAAQQQSRQYGALRRDLDAYLVKSIPQFLEHANRLSGLYTTSFDVICGVAGMAPYMTMMDREAALPDAVATVDAMLSYLLSLAKPDPATGLCCYIANERILIPDRKLLYPKGYADTGLAHGAAGVVAALALALLDGWSAAGLKEGLAELSAWLVRQQVQDEYGTNWPAFLEPSARRSHSSRSAWCYGIPGTARALYLAGAALRDSNLQDTAMTAFKSLLARPRKEWSIASPNICHGLSGVLQAALRMYHDTGAPQLLQLIERVVDEIFSLYNPDTLFGFQDKNVSGEWYDNPRLLEGAPGVALALLAASRPVVPAWDRLLLLA